MRLLKTLLSLSVATALSACAVVVPVIDKETTAPSNCNTYTQSMSLKVLSGGNPGGSCHEECAAALLAILAGSAIISGSIVLTNNTVHWLEYQGTCSDSYLNTTKQLFLDSFASPKPVPTHWQIQ